MTPPKEFPSAPFETARREIDALGIGLTSANKWEHSVTYANATKEQLAGYLAIALQLLRALSPNIVFTDLDEQLTVQFERNGNNIWAKSTTALSPTPANGSEERDARPDENLTQ